MQCNIAYADTKRILSELKRDNRKEYKDYEYMCGL